MAEVCVHLVKVLLVYGQNLYRIGQHYILQCLLCTGRYITLLEFIQHLLVDASVVLRHCCR